MAHSNIIRRSLQLTCACNTRFLQLEEDSIRFVLGRPLEFERHEFEQWQQVVDIWRADPLIVQQTISPILSARSFFASCERVPVMPKRTLELAGWRLRASR